MARETKVKITSAKVNITPSLLEWVKTVAIIVQVCVTAAAIIYGGLLYKKHREGVPRANLTQKVTHRQITAESTWVHITTVVTNIGKVKFEPLYLTTRIRQILPLHQIIKERIARGAPLLIEDEKSVETEIRWPIHGFFKRHSVGRFEPGETNQLYSEFIIPFYVRTIKVNSYIGEQEDPSARAWSTVTIYDLKKEGKGDS